MAKVKASSQLMQVQMIVESTKHLVSTCVQHCKTHASPHHEGREHTCKTWGDPGPQENPLFKQSATSGLARRKTSQELFYFPSKQ